MISDIMFSIFVNPRFRFLATAGSPQVIISIQKIRAKISTLKNSHYSVKIIAAELLGNHKSSLNFCPFSLS